MSMKTGKCIAALLVLFAQAVFCGVVAQKATITETSATMPTYSFGDPDPCVAPDASYYPYWRFDEFDSQKQDKQWKAVILENDYIQVTVFPEIGGKIWGAIDKTRDKAFVYYNHVVKFRDIAMRGAWTSGGIEFNFGIIGHVPTTATPVDYCIQEREDGSVACYVASYELITRTWWTTEIALPKDKAYFTTRVTWANTTPFEQPYYQWMNAAFSAQGDLQLCFPGSAYIGHEGDAHAYPSDDEGRDLSVFSQNAFGHDKSYHVLGEYAQHYGAYWNDDQFGFVHCARPDEKLGRKFFCWSQSREGAIWEDLLTDQDGQYVEMQAGRMFNQPVEGSMNTPFKHHSFAPLSTDSWTEYWYPVEQIGRFCQATPLGALSLRRKGGEADIQFSPTHSTTKTLSVFQSGKKIYENSTEFQALKVFSLHLDALHPDSALRIVLGNQELVYDENPESRTTNRPTEKPKDFDANSAYGHYLIGTQYLNIRSFAKAEEELRACLKLDACFAPALSRLASLFLQRGRASEAEPLLAKALAINTYDGEANYLWGVLHMQQHQITMARDGFSLATYTASYRGASYMMLARIALSEGNLQEASTYLRKAMEASPSCIDAQQLQILLLRRQGRTDEAKRLLGFVLRRIPLSPVARFESVLLGQQSAQDFTSSLRCEMPEQTLLEAAFWYLQAGGVSEALQITSLHEFPLLQLLRAYLLRDTDTNASDEAFRRAMLAKPDFVFPFRPEMRPVLQWAESKDGTWKSRYYLALLSWHLGDVEEAKRLLVLCDDAPFAPLFLTRARLLDGEQILADLQRAEQLSSDWRVGYALANYHFGTKAWDKALEVSQRYYRKNPSKFEIGFQYAQALIEVGQYEKSIQVLNRLRVMPKEGARSGHALWRRAHLELARKQMAAGQRKKVQRTIEASKEWNENLGVGKPYDDLIDYTEENAILQGNNK